MVLRRGRSALPARTRGPLPTIALAAAMAACQPASQPAPAPAPPPAPAALPIPPFEATVVRLQDEQARRLAREVWDEVSYQVAPGLELSLWAPQPLVADPIGLSVDSLGRVFVTRTARPGRAEIDIRGHQDWMVPSITFTSVEDKRSFYLRELAPERSARNGWLSDHNRDGSRDWRDLTVHKERVYRVEDRNGDGVADFSQLILEDFNDLVSDAAHGVLAYNGDLYLTLSPDLWRLRDSDGDGVVDSKQSLAHGSGVHIGFGGHGLSNPIIGPDGRLYWKQGDLGVNLTTVDGRRVSNPHSGVILRANPDGTELEIFASGLRNPQEFAFDEYGNLITADNDGDHAGETERLVYVTEGSDSGWRIHWQFGKYTDPDNNRYNVWMDEGLYRPRFAGQAAFITPPIAAYHAGPSGMAYNPGTALSEEWKDFFFVSVFVGTPANSKIQGFRLRESGAGFELADDRVVVDGFLGTGMRFGPDGALYLADWVEGWRPKDRGRIWKLDAPGAAASALRAETRALIAASLHGRPAAEVAALLRHPDQRVRLKAQFELARRSAAEELVTVARRGDHRLARVHALWGIAQLARTDPRQARPLTGFLRDRDAEVRAQAARMIGDVRYAPAAGALVALLRDPEPRVRFFAAEALGRIGHRPAVPALVRMLDDNGDADAHLRHAGSLALARIGQAEPLLALADHPDRGVRLAAVVALRRMRHPGVADFLRDGDPLVATEAARAVNDDGGIPAALPALAAGLDGEHRGEPFARRAINANLRLGTAAAAQRVARYALRAAEPDTLRAEAVAVLGVWPQPSILDRVDGAHLGVVQRDTAIARAALAPLVEPLFADGSAVVQVALAEAVGRLQLRDAAPLLLARVSSGAAPAVRIAALRGLRRLGDARAEQAVRLALRDPETAVRMAALQAVSSLGLPEATAVELLTSVLERGSIPEQQSALAALGRLPGSPARAALARLVDQLARGVVAPEIQLDVAEAARATGHEPLLAGLDRIEQARQGRAPVEAFADVLRGGDAGRGEGTVFWNPAGQCTRCHGFADRGPSVGPNLRGVASRLSREQLLEALVDPGARIAPGYGPVTVTLRDGQRVQGTLREESESHLVVEVGGEPRRIAKRDVAQRVNGPSGMPPMHFLLSRRELRDVVEYLSTLR